MEPRLSSMAYVIGIAVVVGLLLILVKVLISEDPYSKMTEDEFQAEAERSTTMGAAVLGFHKILQPKRVESMLKAAEHVEADATQSGDRPPDSPELNCPPESSRDRKN